MFKENIVYEKNNSERKKSESIKINSTLNSNIQYDLDQIYFDPNKGSPPNLFINKLLIRINKYNLFEKKL
jgi:hypothetical protein